MTRYQVGRMQVNIIVPVLSDKFSAGYHKKEGVSTPFEVILQEKLQNIFGVKSGEGPF
jgi:hypothetical protein